MEQNSEIKRILQATFEKLNEKIDSRRIDFMAWLIIALCKIKTVNYQALAEQIGRKATTSSNFKSIQRFMKSDCISMYHVASMIHDMIAIKGKYVLIMDRTNWKFGDTNINILMLAIKHDNIAYPLMFKLLDKKGNSNTQERIELMNEYIEWFGVDNIEYFTADREFVGKHWIAYLQGKSINYIIRIRNNFKVSEHKYGKHEFCVSELLQSVDVDNSFQSEKKLFIKGNPNYVIGLRKTTESGEGDNVILITNMKTDTALEKYKSRWQIECLFKGMKTSGFNLEKTHVKHPNRLRMLISLVMIAFVWCYNVGEYVHKHIMPIKVKSHDRRAMSVFKYGLSIVSRWLSTDIKYDALEPIRLFFADNMVLSCT